MRFRRRHRYVGDVCADATGVGRRVGIIFKYAGDANLASPPDEADIRRLFTVEVPRDFIDGGYGTIDNSQVTQLAKIR